MTIDNFNIVAPWFDNLSDQGDFFFVQVIQRNKECNVNSSGHVIKDYHFFDKDTFFATKDEIITLCNAFNARAYFWVNPRNCKEIQYEIIKEALEALELGTRKLFKCVSKAIGRKRNNKYKSKWILDFDTKDWSIINKYLEIVFKCRPDGIKVNTFIKTVNGIHVIIDPFDLEQFKQKVALFQLDNIDIHRDNPTVLYYSNE